MATATEVEVEGRTVRLTNLDKVLYPATGFTKAAVLDYYARVAPVLLPHVRGRPLTLRRFPDGVQAGGRFQKCCPDRRPPWLSVALVPRMRGGEDMPFCVVDDLPSLLWSANQANLELHPMLSTVAALDRPTVVAFDLDPGPPAGLAQCAEVALLLRDMLAAVGLTTFVKTSGGKGLQVFAPLNTRVTYAETKAFARAVAATLASRLPELVVATISRGARAGKVLVDWGQNDRHKSIVSAYSLRGRPEPTVSTPLDWDELEAAFADGRADALVFGPDDVLRRIDQNGDVFADVLRLKQRLPTDRSPRIPRARS